MRQHKWMEYLEDYDFTLHYHPSKANVVVDAPNQKSRGVLASIASWGWQMLEAVGQFGLHYSGTVRSSTGDEGWAMHSYGSLWYRGLVVVPQLEDMREEILKESHRSHFTMHSGGTKMYHDLRRWYYWGGMKKHVGDFVRRCLTCQQVKVEH